MKLVPVALTVAILSLAACSKAPEEPAAPASPEDQFIADVSTALGGQSNIEAVNTVAVEGGGSLQNVGQDMLPESTELKFEISGYRIAADLNARYSRTEQTRTPQFIYFRGPDPITEVFGIAEPHRARPAVHPGHLCHTTRLPALFTSPEFTCQRRLPCVNVRLSTENRLCAIRFSRLPTSRAGAC